MGGNGTPEDSQAAVQDGLMNELGLRTTADLTRYAVANHIIIITL